MEKSKRKTAMRAAAVLLCIAAAAFGIILTVRAVNRAKAYNVSPLEREELDELPLEQADKLMIVAHPDDETIWGGGHLKEGGYLVVCITNGRNEVRKKEFTDAVEHSGNIPLILEYPDKVNGKRDEWEAVYEQITGDIELVMGCKAWSMIVTHNPEGEYGHIHHKLTSRITTDVYEKLSPDCKLWFFGKYYKAKDLPDVKDSLTHISEEQLSFKEELGKYYSSQAEVFEKLSHMMPYEEWQEYKVK